MVIYSFIQLFPEPSTFGGGCQGPSSGSLLSEHFSCPRALGHLSGFYSIRAPRLGSAVSSCPYRCPSFCGLWASSLGAFLVGLLAPVVSSSVPHVELQGARGDGVLRPSVGVMASQSSSPGNDWGWPSPTGLEEKLAQCIARAQLVQRPPHAPAPPLPPCRHFGIWPCPSRQPGAPRQACPLSFPRPEASVL